MGMVRWARGACVGGLVASLAVGCGRGSAAALFDVTGRVVDQQGIGREALLVSIPGHATVVTDDDGHFVVPDVYAPYSLVLHDGDTPDEATMTFLNLRRANPTLLWPSGTPGDAESSISGVVPSGDLQTELRVFLDTQRRHFASSSPPLALTDHGTGAFHRTIQWDGPASTVVTLRALRHTVDADGMPSEFTGQHTGSTTLEDGVHQALLNSIRLEEVSTGTISGLVSNPRDTVFTAIEVSLRWAPHAVHRLARLRLTDAFAVAVPVIPGAAVDLIADSGIDGGGLTRLRRVDVAPGTTGLDMDVPAPARGIWPPAGSILTEQSVLAATPYPGRVYEFHVVVSWLGLDPPFPTGPRYTIVSDDHQVSMPDLRFLGIELPADTPYQYMVITMGPYDSIDDAVGPQGMHSRDHDGQFTSYSNLVEVRTAP